MPYKELILLYTKHICQWPLILIQDVLYGHQQTAVGRWSPLNRFKGTTVFLSKCYSISSIGTFKSVQVERSPVEQTKIVEASSKCKVSRYWSWSSLTTSIGSHQRTINDWSCFAYFHRVHWKASTFFSHTRNRRREKVSTIYSDLSENKTLRHKFCCSKNPHFYWPRHTSHACPASFLPHTIEWSSRKSCCSSIETVQPCGGHVWCWPI